MAFDMENEGSTIVCDLTVPDLIDVLINRIKETNGLEFVDKMVLVRLNCLIGNEILDRDD